MTTYVNSRSKTIDLRTAHELEYFRRYAQMESVGMRMWDYVLTDEDRVSLGSDFAAAFREGGTLGMYGRLYPSISLERVMLEVLLELGAMQIGVYRRLLRQIGENDYRVDSRGSRPRWNGRELCFNGQVVRKIARPGQATRLTSILETFERHGWPHHLSVDKLGNRSAKWMSDSLDELRKGLVRIAFEMDGSGTGINWRPL